MKKFLKKYILPIIMLLIFLLIAYVLMELPMPKFYDDWIHHIIKEQMKKDSLNLTKTTTDYRHKIDSLQHVIDNFKKQ